MRRAELIYRATQLHADGNTYREIAKELNVSLGTVFNFFSGDLPRTAPVMLPDSGNYLNGKPILTEAEAHNDDPLYLLIAMESLDERED